MRAWIDGLQKDGEGARTVQMAVMVLKRSYNVAVGDDDLDHSPIAKVKLPSAEPREQHTLTLKETHRLLTAALATEWGCLFYLAVATGARQGELLALTWDNVDLSAGYASVTSTLSRGEEGKLRPGPTKTKASKRTLFLDPGSLRLLREHQSKLKESAGSGLVFPGMRGAKYLSKDNLTSKVLPMLLGEAKIASNAAIPFHSLRAVGTSLLASKGVPESTLARRLGHGKRTVTARYTTTYDPDLQGAAALMGRLLARC